MKGLKFRSSVTLTTFQVLSSYGEYGRALHKGRDGTFPSPQKVLLDSAGVDHAGGGSLLVSGAKDALTRLVKAIPVGGDSPKVQAGTQREANVIATSDLAGARP